MNDEDMDSLTSKADRALKQAKTAGRNRVIAG
jgi:PleD family two-component response regulator